MKQPTGEITLSPVAGVTDLRGPVLIVDSDAAVRRVLRLVLEGAGYRCIGCPTTEDAPALVTEHRPTLVLVEANLAEGDQELARRITSGDGWRPKVALMSAYPRRRKGYEDFFVSKPVEFDRLLGLLDGIEREQSH